MLFELIAAALFFGGIAALAWSAVQGWIDARRTVETRYADVIREKLASGNYRVVVAVVDGSYRRTAEKTWDEATLDDEMKNRFGGSDRIQIFY